MTVDEAAIDGGAETFECVCCGVWWYLDSFQELNPHKCENCCIELYDPIEEVSESAILWNCA